jgi:lactoylglutathione lyase
VPKPTVFNHVGLCVSDRVRSRAFYERVFDFTFWWELEPPDEGTDVLLQLPRPIGLHATYLYRDGLVLELLEYGSITVPEWKPRSMAELGLTHMSFSVANVTETLQIVKAAGGSVVEESRTPVGAVMVRDPDGQFIELLGPRWPSSLPPRPQ